MHECVFSGPAGPGHEVHTLDMAKRLLDFGFHPPTIYFPMIVPEAIMIEPTETESKETLDAFCEAMIAIAGEAEDNPDLVKGAPYTTPVDGSTSPGRPEAERLLDRQIKRWNG